MKKPLFLVWVLILLLHPQINYKVYAEQISTFKQIDKPDSVSIPAENTNNSLFYFISLSVAYMFYTVVKAKPVDRDEDGF